MKNIRYSEVEIAYGIEGKGDITLLFVHGAFINQNYWAAQVGYFKHDYQVVAIDLPGHGKSGKNRTVWTIEELGNDVCNLIETLHLKNVILIGHSMGGDVILEVAVRCPTSVIGFVGVDNFKNAGSAMPAEIQTQVEPIMAMLKSDFANTSEYYARQALLSPATDQAITNRVVADYRNMDKDIGYDLIDSSFTYYERQRSLMNRLKLKMYLINVDYIPTNMELLNKYAHSGYAVIPIEGTSHYPMIEKPDNFNWLLHDVIAEIEANNSGSK
jgi:sigma-B regulation protein RsbQ